MLLYLNQGFILPTPIWMNSFEHAPQNFKLATLLLARSYRYILYKNGGSNISTRTFKLSIVTNFWDTLKIILNLCCEMWLFYLKCKKCFCRPGPTRTCRGAYSAPRVNPRLPMADLGRGRKGYKRVEEGRALIIFCRHPRHEIHDKRLIRLIKTHIGTNDTHLE